MSKSGMSKSGMNIDDTSTLGVELRLQEMLAVQHMLEKCLDALPAPVQDFVNSVLNNQQLSMFAAKTADADLVGAKEAFDMWMNKAVSILDNIDLGTEPQKLALIVIKSGITFLAAAMEEEQAAIDVRYKALVDSFEKFNTRLSN